MTGPLHGIRIVEFAGLGPVPYAGMLLSDSGADILRIDRMPTEAVEKDQLDLVERGRRGNLINRGRSSVCLDLKSTVGRELTLDILASADGLLEGYRPDVMGKLGIGPAHCMERNARLVYGRVTGWGRDGPLSDEAGHDINYLALSGVLSAIGPKDSPAIPLNLIADFGGGGALLAFGVSSALLEVARTGIGQVVDVAMLDGVASLATYIYSMKAAQTWVEGRESNVLDGGAPFYSIYQTQDENYVAVGAIEPQFYRNLVAGLGLDLSELPPQLERSTWPQVRATFAHRFRLRPREEWIEIFAGKDACLTPVLSMGDAPSHPHFRDSFVEIDGVRQPKPVPTYSNSPPILPTPPPAFGWGGSTKLKEWGIGTDRIHRLVDAGDVYVGPEA